MSIDALPIEAAMAEQVASHIAHRSYGTILEQYGLAPREEGLYLQVGELELVQGWVLHISAILPQIEYLLHAIIPILKKERVVFTVIKDPDTANANLNGYLGPAQLGKIVSIYPKDQLEACDLINILKPITQNFFGPAIPTDVFLGANLYTRYGCHRGVEIKNASGKKEFCIYGLQGRLIPDLQQIPFVLPQGVTWPFADFGNPNPKTKSSVLNGRYKPIVTLKEDSKGNVHKALYFNKFVFVVRPCILKQGKAHMLVDESGRDIRTRLAWQKELYEDLKEVVPMAKILDLFRIGDDDYLVMEFVKGTALFQHVNALNYRGHAWLQLSELRRETIFGYIFQLLDIVGRLHEQGIIHRDITPVNFLVRRSRKLVLIDMELAYSVRKGKPTPPFGLGTVGFMSPEQQRADDPTPKEDIYGLAATLVTMFTGLPPGNFTPTGSRFEDNLNFFLEYHPLATTLSACLSPEPGQRPGLAALLHDLENYRSIIRTRKFGGSPAKNSVAQIDQIIEAGILGLISHPMPIKHGLWHSFTAALDGLEDTRKRSFSKSIGLAEGITGTLYFLARAHSAGIVISPCRQAYETNWAYVYRQLDEQYSTLAPGLYGGQAGIALALVAGMDAGLLPKDQTNRQHIQACLTSDATECNLANGVAGIGIAALRAAKYLPEEFASELVHKHLIQLNSLCAKGGYWLYSQQGKNKKLPVLSFAYGNSGIIWYLLALADKSVNKQAANIARKLLATYPAYGYQVAKSLSRHGFRQFLLQSPFSDTLTGIILVLLKAYKIFDDSEYRKSVESIMRALPDTIIHENYTQNSGLAGLGELYLEAFKILEDPIYLERAKWIANLVAHTSAEGAHRSRYWLINNAVSPTADFLTGCSGILHFLTRIINPRNLPYRLLEWNEE